MLLERGGVEIVDPLGADECGRERFGHDEITDAESGKDGAGEGSDVDDAAIAVETLERFEGMAFVMEFAVVIVLDDDGVLAVSPLEQRQATRERENCAGGELVRGSDKDQGGLIG